MILFECKAASSEKTSFPAAKLCNPENAKPQPASILGRTIRPSARESDLPRLDRIVILRGQLRLIRERAERGIPLSVETIRRAEDLASSLETDELPR